MINVPNDMSVQSLEVAGRLDKINKVILIGSGKGGVGKSFVASGLAYLLSTKGFRTGVLDLDLHGASLPSYFGVKPPLKSGKAGLEPKRVGRLRVMSLALLTGDRAVPLFGRKKRELIGKLFSITNWGNLDYLIVDLPPGTGDEVLTSFELFSSRCCLILVTTPSHNALKVVSRLAALARIERIVVSGIVVNMGYSKIGKKIVYPFGKAVKRSLEKYLGSKILAEFPLDSRVGTLTIKEIMSTHSEVASVMEELAATLSRYHQ